VRVISYQRGHCQQEEDNRRRQLGGFCVVVAMRFGCREIERERDERRAKAAYKERARG
jgi:hypothetical protein